MYLKHFSFGVGLIALAFASAMALPARAADEPHAEAVKACSAFNSHAGTTLVTAVDDGRGGSLVWLTNHDDLGLWLCSADSEGHIYAYATILDDMLEGAGASLVDDEQVASSGDVAIPEKNPIDVAERACQAYFDGEKMNVIGSGQDGLEGDWLPGYYVFLETDAGKVFLCDATADAQVWAVAEINDPLISGNQVG